MKPLLLKAPDGEFEVAMDFQLGDGDTKGPVFRKELAYPGHFVKFKGDSTEPEFELPVDEGQLDQWVDTFHTMKKNGIDVPMPLGHTTEPTARRGTVVDLRKEPNPKRKGGVSLYAYCQFNDPKDAKQYKNSNVSLFMPPSFRDGVGRQYIRPIRHVAITDYPVIPGLEPFQTVAAAFELSLAEEGDNMSWIDVAEELGIKLPEGADEEAAKAAVKQAWEGENSGEGDVADEEEVPEAPEGGEDVGDPEGEEEPTGEEDDDFSFEAPDDEFGADDGGDFVDDEGDDEMRTQGAPPAMSAVAASHIPFSLVKRESENRKAELQRLVFDRKISPAAASALARRYCSTENVGVALSLETQMDSSGDDFDSIVAALSLNPEGMIANVGPKTGPQVAKAEKSPLVQDAERRNKR